MIIGIALDWEYLGFLAGRGLKWLWHSVHCWPRRWHRDDFSDNMLAGHGRHCKRCGFYVPYQWITKFGG